MCICFVLWLILYELFYALASGFMLQFTYFLFRDYVRIGCVKGLQFRAESLGLSKLSTGG